jgi:hypothetical protein
MKALRRIAIVAFAGLGALTFAQAQGYANKFRDNRSEIDRLMHSMKYGEVVKIVQAILPAGIPDFPQNPADPAVGLNNYSELGSILDFHEVLYKALLASGDKEGAIVCIKKAEEIAKRNAVDTEAAMTPTIESWSTAVEESTKNIEEATPIKEQLAAEKSRIESMPKRKKADNQRLAVVEADLDSLEQDMAVWENNLKTAPAIVNQLNRYINTAKKDSAKFAQEIKDMESDLADEKDVIDSKFKGDKVKYVTAALPNANSMSPRDKVQYLNRLLFLDPNSAAVRKQLDAALASI